MYKRAVVPLDGSIVAESILPFLMEIAGPLDVELALVRVVRPLPRTVAPEAAIVKEIAVLRRDAEEYLAPLAGTLRDRGLRVQTHVHVGDPAEEILTAARQVGADLIAMTTHGRSGLGRLLFGSVAEAVLRQSDVPVFLMRQTETAMAGARSVADVGSGQR